MLTTTGQHVTAASMQEKFSVDMGLVASMKLKSALLHQNYANSRVISLEFLSFTLKNILKRQLRWRDSKLITKKIQ
jgi:hypothetical protein